MIGPGPTKLLILQTQKIRVEEELVSILFNTVVYITHTNYYYRCKLAGHQRHETYLEIYIDISINGPD